MRKVDSIVERYGGEESYLIGILQDIQAEFRYLPREALERVSEKMGVPLSRLYSLATFFRAFSLSPRGEHLIVVCTGTACHVRGAPVILDALKGALGIEPGGTTSDLKYTLETVNCLGSCALAPLVVVDGRYHGKVRGKDVVKLIEEADEAQGA